MVTAMKSAICAIFVVLCGLIATAQQGSWRLLTFTTHFSETPNGINAGNTRVLIFSMTAGDQQMKVERTGYRGARINNGTLLGDVPKYMHNGRLADDLVYGKDTAFYAKMAQ